MALTLRVTSRRTTRIVLVLAVLTLAAMAWDAVALWRAQRLNAAIRNGRAASLPAAEAHRPEVQFARAAAAAASGAEESALNLYRPLQADTTIGESARYNSANLLLRQAVRVRDSGQPGQALPLIELAKETYREVLRNDPGHWNARYNLERAQRLVPEPDENDDTPPPAPEKAERAATTMRGYSPGLP